MPAGYDRDDGAALMAADFVDVGSICELDGTEPLLLK